VRTRTLHRLHTGVYAVGFRPATRETRWMAAVLASGPTAALSHIDAAMLWEIHDASGVRVHVIASSNRKVSGICVHRARHLHPDDVTERDGIPVTTVARTLVDLTDILSEDRILRAMREAEFKRLLDHDSLKAAVERASGRRNARALKRAMAVHKPGQVVHGELEHRFLELVRSADIRAPETNVRVETKRRTYILDCLWRAEGVAVELDGRAAHARVMAFEEDRERDVALSAIGLRPVRFTWHRIKTDGVEVIANLTAMLSRRGGA
jgi:very-short-patch-repair endonuclease